MEIKLTTGMDYRKGLLQSFQPYTKLRGIAISICYALNASDSTEVNYRLK